MKNILKFIFLVVLILLTSCGGSTQGTGGITVEGKVLTTDGTPLEMINVTATENGEAAVSDSQGNFRLETEDRGTVELEFRGDGIDARTMLENIANNIRTVKATFRVDKKRNSVKPENVESREDDSNDDNSSSGSGSDDDSGDNSSSGSDDDDNSNSGSGSDNDSDDNNDDSNDGSGSSSGSGGSSDDGSGSGSSGSEERIEQRGTITAISSTAVVVNGTSFIPTAETRYKDIDGDSTTLDSFHVQDLVKAKGKSSASDILLLELEIED